MVANVRSQMPYSTVNTVAIEGIIRVRRVRDADEYLSDR